MAKEKPESTAPEETKESPETNNHESVVVTADAVIVDAAAMNPEAANPPIAEVQAQQVNVMTAPVTMINAAPQVPVTPPLPQGTAADGKYEEFLLMPAAAWPPPIFIRKSVSAQERFYIENRWHSQWNYYDKKANESKKLYYRYQSIVVVGSVIVPVLVSFSSALGTLLDGVINAIFQATGVGNGRFFVDVLTVLTSTLVAIAAAVESLQKYGDGWSSYRSAAEELQAEKYFYDMLAGPYANNPNPFATFVERTEGIVANQNGKYFQAVQQQIQKQAVQNEELLERHKAVPDDDDAPAGG